MRSNFDKQLVLLNRELIEMGSCCEDAISVVTKSLESRDKEAIEHISPIDSEISQKEHTIEAMCLKMLLQQQPVASDLRQISAALKMITDMERIGHQAYDMAEIITYLPDTNIHDSSHIKDMAQSAIKMVRGSVDAYVKGDIDMAQNVISSDDIVDRYFDNIRHELIEVITSDPSSGEYAMDLLMIAKYYERIADHATNIAEWVVFSVTGIHKEDSK